MTRSKNFWNLFPPTNGASDAEDVRQHATLPFTFRAALPMVWISEVAEAIAETQRRRAIQQAYNTEHGITPTTIKKSVQDILVRVQEEKRRAEEVNVQVMRDSFNIVEPKSRKKLIKALEKEMLEHAKNLEFEEAAVLRDEIERLKEIG